MKVSGVHVPSRRTIYTEILGIFRIVTPRGSPISTISFLEKKASFLIPGVWLSIGESSAVLLSSFAALRFPVQR